MNQFRKIKHLADKTFIRPDRTEVLSEDLVVADKRIELIKKTCDSTAKKVAAGLQGSNKDGQQGKEETRIKKNPQHVLGKDMQENGHQLQILEGESSSVLGTVLLEAGEIEIAAAAALVKHENGVQDLLLKLQALMETDEIYKTKKSLNKLSSDMDSAKAKLAQANRHSMSAASGKVDTIKDDLDDASQKFEQCRDNLAAEMYQFLSRESEISQSIVSYLQLQRDYHKAVFDVFDKLLPNVESALANSVRKPVYGISLNEHLECFKRPIAYPIELCVCGLIVNGLREEGLFRMAGSASKVKKLKAAFDAVLIDLDTLRQKFSDPHVIANALKCYLRELNEPLLTYGLYNDWINAIQNSDNDKRLTELWRVVRKLPKSNYDNLRYLIRFLWELSKLQSVNRMSPANIAIVIGPNVLWTPNSDDSASDSLAGLSNMTMTHWYTSLVDQLVTYAEYFFPDEVEFFQTYPRPIYNDVDSNVVPNGSSDEGGSGSIQGVEGSLVSAKRSQSSSSLEDHSSPPQGSPKPVLRRKNKPAPVPPSIPSTTSKQVPTGESSSPKQSISSDSSTSEAAPKRVSSTKRDGIWRPHSPSQTNNRKYNNAKAPGGTSGNVGTSDSLTITSMKVSPPKPPQPQFTQYKEADTKLGSSDATPKSFGQAQYSTLRHKSSFNSGLSGSEGTTGSAGTTSSSAGGGSTLQYSSSLPRHFHTENSYKNQRAPRPPNTAVAIPSVPDASAVADLTSQHSDTRDQGQSHNEKVTISRDSGGNQSDGTNCTAAGQIQNKLNSNSKIVSMNQPGETSGACIGFENIESQVQVNLDANVQASTAEKDVPSKSEQINSSSQSSGSLDGPKPVPAPRSSLLLQNTSKDKESVPPLKERPTLMAKPRDLAKRSHQIVSGTNYPNNQVPEDASQPPVDAQARILPHSIGNRLSSESEQDKEIDDFHLRNGSIKDKNVPPASPRAPNRPPRPQPPPPPKVKAESTDL